jgi:hypothetical protein
MSIPSRRRSVSSSNAGADTSLVCCRASRPVFSPTANPLAASQERIRNMLVSHERYVDIFDFLKLMYLGIQAG